MKKALIGLFIFASVAAFLLSTDSKSMDSRADEKRSNKSPNSKEFFDSGANLYKLKKGMNKDEILQTLGFGKFLNSRTVVSKTVGGIGSGGTSTDYFSHLKDHIFNITTSLDNQITLKWKSPETALIVVHLGNIKDANTNSK